MRRWSLRACLVAVTLLWSIGFWPMGAPGAAELAYLPRTAPDRARIPVATADGQPLVTVGDLNQALSALHFEAAQTVHRRQLQWLTDVLRDEFVGMEADRRKTRPDDLVRSEMKIADRHGPQLAKARAEYGERLRQAASLAVTLAAPDPPVPGGGGADLVYTPRTRQALSRVPVVRIGGQILVDRRAFDEALSIPYYATMLDVHERRLAWLRDTVHERLVAREAGRLGLSADDLLQRELGAQGADRWAWLAAREEYVKRLATQARVRLLLEAPGAPQILAAESSTSPVLGLADAPISVVEFCSFTSAPCRQAWATYREAARRLGDRLRIAHRDAPDPADAPAMLAAIAGRCAERQKKYWPYQERLFGLSGQLGDRAALKALARELGLAPDAFDRCLDQAETAEEVNLDIRETRRLSLRELPTLFVNGTYVAGPLPLEELMARLESLVLP